MPTDVRIGGAVDALSAIQRRLLAIAAEPDPVEQRRAEVRIAQRLRAVADALDDFGRLTE